jgi:hypothetical protein
MSSPGFIDHIGIGVPDLPAAKRYYDELMPILGLRAWFATTKPASSTTAPLALAARRSSSTKHLSRRLTRVMAPACSTCPSRCLAALRSARHTTGRLLTTPKSSMNRANSRSTASTTPRTSLIPTVSCSRSSATAPARRDSRRAGSRRCDGIPALEPAGRPLRRGSSEGRQAAGQAGRWPSVTRNPRRPKRFPDLAERAGGSAAEHGPDDRFQRR